MFYLKSILIFIYVYIYRLT
uniref:Uncharacterized protein n=1 Tax=Anguilla anguilla TaxID=7936 RepID=A0A0E9U690_ANGAN